MSHAHHLSRRRPAALAAAALCAVLWHAPLTARESRVLLMDLGDFHAFAPYNALDAPVLNERGQVALLGKFQTGANSYSVTNLLQWSEASGASGPSTLAGIGPQFTSLRGSISQNDLGQVAFQADSRTSGRYGIYLSSHLGDGPISEVGGLTDYYRETIISLGAPQLARESGTVAFQVRVADAGAARDSLWLIGGGKSGAPLFHGTPILRRLDLLFVDLDNAAVFEPYAVASASKLVMANNFLSTAFAGYFGKTTTGVNFNHLYGAVLFQDPVREHVFPAAYNGQATGTGWAFQNLQNAAPALALSRGRYDGAGLAFTSQLSRNADGSGAQGSGVYRFLSKPDLGADVLPFGVSPGKLTEVARSGTAAPGGGTHLSFDDKVFINDSLQVAYSGFVSAAFGARPTSTKGHAHHSIFIDRADVADEGQLAPTANGGLARRFTNLDLKAMNNAGAVLFTSLLDDPNDKRFDQGAFLGDGRDLVSVVRTGDSLAGAARRQVSSIVLSDNALNSHGQVAYGVTFQDGAIGTYLFTPTLHWRDERGPRGFGFGSWDNANSWTLGLAPAEVHDVKIDPSFRIGITGPTSDRTVRSLDVGTGAGAVALTLQPGVTLSVLEGGLHIGARGTLTGSGTVQGNLVNDGLIRPTSIVVLDRITNHGRIEGGGHLQGSLANGSTGTVSVAADEHLTMFGFVGGPSTNRAHQNLGAITVDGGVLTMIGGLGNQGMLHATDASLGFVGRGLLNHGEVLLDGAHVDVSGKVFNAGSGHIATGNATAVVFHDNVVNAGAFDIGAASSARFLGGLSLTGSSQLSFVLGASALDGAALLTMDGPVGLAGLLAVTFDPNFVAQAGDAFTLFNFSGSPVSGDFASLALADLGSALMWDTDELLTGGRLSIVAAVGQAHANSLPAEQLDVAAVPEPQTWALLLAGLGVIGFTARRRRA